MNNRIIMVVLLIGICFIASCTPSLPEVKIKAGMDLETRETVEGVNETLRETNQTLRSGVNIGPETRQTITNLINQIEQFNESGVLGKDGVEVIGHLADVVDKGLKIGLDVGLKESTLTMVNDISRVIDEQPEKWGEQSQILVRVLGLVATDLADKIAGHLTTINAQVDRSIQGIGEQSRCTIDFAGQTVTRTAEQAGGKFVAGLLPILGQFYKEKKEPPQIPGVCTITPNEVNFVWQDGQLIADKNSILIAISGFNFNTTFPPTVTLQSTEGQINSDIHLKPNFETAYKLTVNLQGKTFNAVKPGSSIVFLWSEVVPNGKFEKAVLVESAPKAIANFTASNTVGAAPLTVKFFDDSSGQPTARFWYFGDGTTSQEENPIHEYKQLGTFSVKLTVKNQFSPPNTHEEKNFVVVNAPPLKANFDVAPRSGLGPLTVTFQDRSEGTPYTWLWDFGDGTSSNSRQPEPHTYTSSGPYTVKLTVRDKFGSEDSREEPNYVMVEPTPTPALPDLVIETYDVNSALPEQGETVQSMIVIRNQGTGVAGQFIVEWQPSGSSDSSQRITVQGLGPEESHAVAFNFVYPNPGNFNAIARVDANNSVVETDEGNNAVGKQIIVRPKPVRSFEDFKVTAHADHHFPEGKCTDIYMVFTIQGGWHIDRSQGDPSHPGISEIESYDNRQSRDSLRGYNYQPLDDQRIHVEGRICGAGGIDGPGAIFERTYRVFKEQ